MTAAQLQDLAANWQDKQLHLRHRPQQQQQQLDIQQLAAFPSQTLNKAIFLFSSLSTFALLHARFLKRYLIILAMQLKKRPGMPFYGSYRGPAAMYLSESERC
jgi:hypothetical protein